MTSESKIIAFRERVRAELRVLATINPSDRTWQMPFAAALATGLPLLIGAYFDRMAYGLVATLGGLVFLYLPPTPMHHRMAVVMAASFAMTASTRCACVRRNVFRACAGPASILWCSTPS